jgi:hypothetical protein
MLIICQENQLPPFSGWKNMLLLLLNTRSKISDEANIEMENDYEKRVGEKCKS